MVSAFRPRLGNLASVSVDSVGGLSSVLAGDSSNNDSFAS